MAWEDDLAALANDRGSALVAYAYLLTGELAAAQDLVQDALVATFSRRRTGAVAHLEAYVRRAVLNQYLNTRRRSDHWRRVVHLVVDDRQPTAPDVAAAASAAAHAALARMTPRERACVVLRHFEDLPLADVAERLDLSEGAVKRYLYDARRRLTPLLGTVVDDLDIDVVEGAVR